MAYVENQVLGCSSSYFASNINHGFNTNPVKSENKMVNEYYNYGLAKDVPSKTKNGMFSGGYQYTTNVYFSAHQAGRELGVATDNIEVVLKFTNDSRFKSGQDVAVNLSRGFVGGASQYSHPGRPKPVAQRKITEKNWTKL